MKHLLFFTFFTFLCAGIINAQPPAGDANVGDVYGQNITANKKIKPKQLEKKLSAGPVEGIISGEVVEVCPNKGCWIKMKMDNDKVVTVKMKDYGFFVPVALTGKKIMVEGRFENVTTSVEELKHLAEDAKKPQSEIDKITEPKQEIKVVANGIKVI